MTSQRKASHLELLQSPVPTQRDLFSQLLVTETKTQTISSTYPQFQIDEDEDFEEYDQIEFKESES